jgi:hypothetical protein
MILVWNNITSFRQHIEDIYSLFICFQRDFMLNIRSEL